MMLNVGKHYPADPEHFEFDAEVTAVFDDMAIRSIPGYAEHFDMIKSLTARAILPDYGQVWDLGCSTGTGLATVDATNRNPLVSFHAVDVSEPMLEAAGERVHYAELYQHDLTAGLPDTFMPGLVCVVMFNWTLQFIADQETRRSLIAQAYRALKPGGYLFIAEKFILDDEDVNLAAQQAYMWWRRSNGYSLAEIQAKSKALANSMWPWKPSDLLSALREAGVRDSDMHWTYRMYNFGGIVVRKPE